jgi:hypothetical protein
MRKPFVLSLTGLVLWAAVASATTIAYIPMKKAIQMSDMVLIGYVVGMKPGYDREGQVVTRIDLLVESSLKGRAEHGQVFSFNAWGGRLDGMNIEKPGEARYKLGQKVLVQLENIDGEYHTLGLAFGKWDVVRDSAGASWIIRNLGGLNLVGLTEVPVERLPLDHMRRTVREAARPAD